MSLSTVLILIAAGAPVAADEPSKEVKEELKHLQGTWMLVGRELDGKKTGEEDVKALEGKLVIKGDRFTYTSRGDATGKRSTFRIDPTANPRRLEWTAPGEEKGEKILAIYKLEGDRLTVCAGGADKRPRDFTTKPGDLQVIVVYQRQQK
jgi:uncharacterized protein (TIGR03067 family)